MEEDIKKRMALVIHKIYELSLNKWVSVKDYSISSIMNEFNINRRFYGHIANVLKDAGLLFTEGEKGCMRYKFKEVAILDADSLAEKVIESERLSSAIRRSNRPLKKKMGKLPYSENGKLSKLKKEPLVLGTKVYFIYRENLVEGIVYGSKLSDKPGKLYEYIIKFTYNKEVLYSEYDYNLLIFLKPEEVTEYLLKNMVKYDTELVAREISKQHESIQSL